MASLIQDVLFQRLVEAGRADDEIALCVLAACEGDEAIDRLVNDGVRPRSPAATTAPAVKEVVPRAFLEDIEVRAFRGIGELALLPIQPGPGVTLVVGRNGSGKSSFAEAAEVALTGTSARWASKKSKEWEKGWRNLHTTAAPRIQVKLTQEGIGRSAIERTWTDPLQLPSGVSHVQVGRRAAVPLASTGWGAALDQYRPFLTYSELGGLLEDGPGRIYQALLAGLGLDEYETVRDRLAAAENARGKLVDTARKSGTLLGTRAQQLATLHPEEGRFGEVAALLQKRQRDPEALERYAVGRALDDVGTLLEALAALTPPIAPPELDALAASLRALATRKRDVGTRAAGLAHKLASLLRDALAVADSAPQDTCPVCGSDRPLDAAWKDATTARLQEMDRTAAEATALERDVVQAIRRAQALCVAPPAPLRDAAARQLTGASDAVARWQAWANGAAIVDLDALADHLETAAPPLVEAVHAVAAASASETARRDQVWQPFATELATWVLDARAADRARVAEKHLKEAKDWVAAAIDAERQARFAPIKQQAIDFWNLISEHSNVRLLDIALTGQGKLQRVTLRVAVDGVEAPALGVMSQGELNAMTLSLFLPRVLMDGTPFGFVIVDDPVQAMDEARVDGLARVLTAVGRTRQVVVFTHDTRLPDAFDRLALPHRCVQVVRAQDSAVSVRSLKGSIEQRLSDATAVARTPDLPEDIAGRVVPGFCRQALEAACMESLRRRWLTAGESHAEVEARLHDVTLRELLSLVFFKDRHSTKDLGARLKQTGVADADVIIRDCQEGAHDGFPGDLAEMVERTRKLCEALRKVK